MRSDEKTIQDEFQELLKAQLSERLASGKLRSRWSDELVEKFRELKAQGYDLHTFLKMGLSLHQHCSLNARAFPRQRPKLKPVQSSFKKLNIEKTVAPAKTIEPQLYLRNSRGVELHGFHCPGQAFEFFIKATK